MKYGLEYHTAKQAYEHLRLTRTGLRIYRWVFPVMGIENILNHVTRTLQGGP
jgi:hypothetical protein